MKKYILTSIMSLILIAGTGLLLTATETEGKKEKASSCCTSTQTAEVTKTAEASSCCSSGEKTAQAASCAGKTSADACCSNKATKAEAESSDVQMIQTSNSAVSGCAGSAPATQVAGPRPGECTKVPSGIRSQQANRDN